MPVYLRAPVPISMVTRVDEHANLGVWDNGPLFLSFEIVPTRIKFIDAIYANLNACTPVCINFVTSLVDYR